MIRVHLKMQPEGEPKRVDGLLWGGTEPVQFGFDLQAPDELKSRNGTYVMQLVIGSNFPKSKPIEIVKIDREAPATMFDHYDLIEAAVYDRSPLASDQRSLSTASAARYKVCYENDEIRYLKDFEYIERKQPAPMGGENSDTRDVVEFSNGFKRIRVMSASLKIVKHDVPLGRARNTDLALSYLFEHRNEGWLEWNAVVKAAGNPAWSDEKKPSRWLHGGHPGKKKDCLEYIIEDGGNSSARKVQLKHDFNYRAM